MGTPASPFADLVPSASAGCGWFGKIACLGDFGSRRLPPEFVQSCDPWLSRCLEASRARLGERWLQTYLTAPVWRFAWSPGLVGTSWWFGILMPSVDRVGRYFPLVVAEAASGPPLSPPEQQALARWYQEIAAAALATLQPHAAVEAFDARLQATPGWSAQAQGPLIEPLAAQGLPGRARYDARAALSLPEWIGGLGTQMVLQALQGRSLWWSAADGAGSMSLADGLPAPEQFAELLEGSW